MYNVPEEYLRRMRVQLGDEFALLEDVYTKSPERVVRVNRLKDGEGVFEKIFPYELGDAVVAPKGDVRAYYCPLDGIGRTVEYAQGLIYPQEASAMFVVPYMEVHPGERVLDLCAAPGGKSTQIAECLDGDGVLFSNEINTMRARMLYENITRHGVRNCVITSVSPDKMSLFYEGFFDKILVDAPCSGEGMFRKEEKAISDWSPRNVVACAKRQREILDNASRMLAHGGLLVYSTCTFSPEEDEMQVEDFCRRHLNFTLLCEEKFLPYKVRGEGHFVAVMKKSDENDDCSICDRPRQSAFDVVGRDVNGAPGTEKDIVASFADCCGIDIDGKYVLKKFGSSLYGLSRNMIDFYSHINDVYTLCAGVKLGEVEKGVFKPCHQFAMSLKHGEADSVEVDRKTAVRYLAGESFDCDSVVGLVKSEYSRNAFSGSLAQGWKVVTHNGFSLGWCKMVNGVAKNHFPKNLRISRAF